MTDKCGMHRRVDLDGCRDDSKIKLSQRCHFLEIIENTHATFCKLMGLTHPRKLRQRRVAGGGDAHFSALFQFPENAMMRVSETANSGNGLAQKGTECSYGSWYTLLDFRACDRVHESAINRDARAADPASRRTEQEAERTQEVAGFEAPGNALPGDQEFVHGCVVAFLFDADRAWDQGIHSNRRATQLMCQRACKALDCGLGRRIGGKAGCSEFVGNRAGENDASLRAETQCRQDGAGKRNCCKKIDLKNGLPKGGISLLKCTPRVYRRVVQDEINRLSSEMSGELGNRFRLRKVAFEHLGLEMPGIHLRLHLCECFPAPADQKEAEPLRQKSR